MKETGTIRTTEYLALIISFAALVVSVMAWHKSRVVYEIITENYKMGMEQVNGLLKSGKYTILHIQPDPINVIRKIYVLGKISN